MSCQHSPQEIFGVCAVMSFCLLWCFCLMVNSKNISIDLDNGDVSLERKNLLASLNYIFKARYEFFTSGTVKTTGI